MARFATRCDPIATVAESAGGCNSTLPIDVRPPTMGPDHLDGTEYGDKRRPNPDATPNSRTVALDCLFPFSPTVVHHNQNKTCSWKLGPLSLR